MVTWVMGQFTDGSRGSWVSSLMGHVGQGSHGSWVSSLAGQMSRGSRGLWVSSMLGRWVTKFDPLSALVSGSPRRRQSYGPSKS